MNTNPHTTSPFPTFTHLGREFVRVCRGSLSGANRPLLGLLSLFLGLAITGAYTTWNSSRETAMPPTIHELNSRGVSMGIMEMKPRVWWLHYPPYVQLSTMEYGRLHVWLKGCNRLNSETWSMISQLESIWCIDLSDTEFNADELRPLTTYAGLYQLCLSRSNLDDASLASLATLLPQIREINLDDTAITDDSVKTLITGFPGLISLGISGTNITDKGLTELMQARPTLIIVAPTPRPVGN